MTCGICGNSIRDDENWHEMDFVICEACWKRAEDDDYGEYLSEEANQND